MMALKKMGLTAAVAAVMALAIGFGSNVAYASTTSVCPDDNDSSTRAFTLTTADPVVNSCYFWGPGNDANSSLFETQRVTDFGTDHGLVSKVEFDTDGVLQREGSNKALLNQSVVNLLGGTGGSFSVDTTGLKDILLVFKTGSGGSDPDFAAFSLTPPGQTTGSWAVTLQQSLSHVSLYGTPAPIPLPAGAILLITALGGLGIAARRRRNKAA